MEILFYHDFLRCFSKKRQNYVVWKNKSINLCFIFSANLILLFGLATKGSRYEEKFLVLSKELCEFVCDFCAPSIDHQYRICYQSVFLWIIKKKKKNVCQDCIK